VNRSLGGNLVETRGGGTQGGLRLGDASAAQSSGKTLDLIFNEILACTVACAMDFILTNALLGG
jgi:hypothetical protein